MVVYTILFFKVYLCVTFKELARNALQRQQQELESMRQRKIQDEDERLIFQHLSQMKEEVNRCKHFDAKAIYWWWQLS